MNGKVQVGVRLSGQYLPEDEPSGSKHVADIIKFKILV